jgi:hypothetical protein
MQIGMPPRESSSLSSLSPNLDPPTPKQLTQSSRGTGAKMCLHKDDSISTLIFEVVQFGTSIARFVGVVEENPSF